MKILFVVPEVAPFVKVGGLADVAGSLPKALEALGHDVRIVCPLHGSIKKDGAWLPHGKPLCVPMGDGMRYGRVWETMLPGSSIACYFIEYDEYFARPEVYEGPWGWHGDNDRRFAFLSRASLELTFWLNWMPDVLHVHDWATALVPVMLNTLYADTPLGKAATVLTIHNLQHQGYCDRSVLDFAGLPSWVYTPEHVEAMGAVCMLKGGIFHSTKLTTVSPTYAAEIQTLQGGQGMQELLQFRSADLIGVLNGIDSTTWSPKVDSLLPSRYCADDLSGKAECKKMLCGRLGLNYSAETPILGVVSRLYDQKGLDLLDQIIPRLMESMTLQIVVLGTGDAALERAFCEHQARYTGRVATWIGFDEMYAHLIYAGSDFFLMPSRFEPCGLGQMYAMNYGTPPIARATGGLKDTIEQSDKYSGSGTGFLFTDPSPQDLFDAISCACNTWYDHPEHYRSLQIAGMKKDFSWNSSARAYADVYRWAVDERLGLAVVEAQA